MGSEESFSRVHKKKFELDDDKLIEIVRDNRALYDHDHCKYADTQYREKVWKQISAELKQPALFCKKRWGNIRDNYKKALRKIALKSDKGKTAMKKYKYSDQLEFLGIIFEDRDSINISPLEIKHELDIENHTEESEHFDNASQTDTRASYTDDEEKCSHLQQFVEHKRGLTLKRKYEESESDQSKVMNYIVERMETDTRTIDRHPVDAFLSGIAPTLKSLSPYYLSLVKTQIYSIVQEYEMAMIMDQKNGKNPT